MYSYSPNWQLTSLGDEYIDRVFLICSRRILENIFFIFSLSFIPLPSTIFTKMFTGCTTRIFRSQWYGSCKLEHRHRLSHAQLCDDRSDMGNLKSVSRLDAFNYIPIYIQCKKSLQKCHFCFIRFKTKMFERVTLFLSPISFISLFWSDLVTLHENSNHGQENYWKSGVRILVPECQILLCPFSVH